jgi:FkbM family methyltransferase
MVSKTAVVHKHQNYDTYERVIADCDMFLNPFPFGNTNGIVDTVWAGLVGVNKTGREVHEHIDEGMFTRLGFPEWMTARTSEEYKQAALRLINNPEERAELAAKYAGPKAIEKLIFEGRPQILGERIMELWKALPQEEETAKKGKKPSASEKKAAGKKPARTVRHLGPAGIPGWLAKEVEVYFSVPLRTKPKTIVNIGGGAGAFALRARKQWPTVKVISYEPLPSNVARMRANLDAAWAEVIPCAVRAEAGPQGMYMGDMFVTGSFNKGNRQTINRITVDCVAAADLPSCDLLKIDTEGVEVEILAHANLDGINAILLEYHNRADAETIQKQLAAAGFDCLYDSDANAAVGQLIFERKGAESADLQTKSGKQKNKMSSTDELVL